MLNSFHYNLMRRTRLAGPAVGLALCVLLSTPAGARPPELRVVSQVSGAAGLPHSPASSSALGDTTFFGGTVWDAGSMRWEALEDSTWTFDTGVGGPLEGWTSIDRTEVPSSQRMRRLSSADPRWTGTPCVGTAGGLGGSWSFWAGLFESEADSLCYVSGRGYGNNWNICIGRSFDHTKNGATSVTFEFDYTSDAEDGFDITLLSVEKNGVKSDLVQLTGVLSGHYSVNLTATELPSPPGPATFTFCFTADGAWSDEDGLNATDCGAFAVDNISLSGDITAFTDFESDDGGWTVLPVDPAPGGDWARLEHLGDLPPTGLPPCGLADSVLVFFDPDFGPDGGHNDFQDNLAMSPWIDLAAAGVDGLPGKTLLFDAYARLFTTNYIFGEFAVQWYPDTCAASGAIGNSPLVLRSAFLDFGSVPICKQWAVDLSEEIPPWAEQIRVGVGVVNICRFYNTCNFNDPSPWFDNVRLGVHEINTIQYLIDTASPGDTVYVPPGVYTGNGNRNISFGGKSLVLLGTGGPAATIIDVGSGRGFSFYLGEDTTSVVSGFTIRNAQTSGGGAGIFVGAGSGMTLENCVVEDCYAGGHGGAIYMDPAASAVRVRNSTFQRNTSGASGGGIHAGADFRIEDSFLLENDASDSGGGLFSNEDVDLLRTTVSGNTASLGGGVFLGFRGRVEGCELRGNIAYDGGGAVGYLTDFIDCEVVENSAQTGGGLVLYGSTAQGCRISGNDATFTGGGVYTEFRVFDLIHYPAQVLDCVVDGNVAGVGGGITAGRGTPGTESMYLERSTVSGNRAGTLGGGVYSEKGMAVQGIRSILWGNCAGTDGDQLFLEDTSSVTLTCAAYDPAGVSGPGNFSFNGAQITSDPLFCHPWGCVASPSTGGIYSLLAGSPCLPAGSPCGLLVGALGQEGCAVGGVPGDGGRPVPNLSVFPNPFAGSVHLTFRGSETGTRIVIYDIQGRVVRTEQVPGAVGTWTWDGMDSSGRVARPGVYFVQIHFDAGNSNTASSRMVKMR